MTNTLLDRWLTVLRASGPFAIGRECDYAMTEHDADRFDPIGLLAIAAGDGITFDATHTTGWRHTNGGPGVAPGAWLTRWAAEELARHVGLDPSLLPELAELSDSGWNGFEVADWVRRNTL